MFYASLFIIFSISFQFNSSNLCFFRFSGMENVLIVFYFFTYSVDCARKVLNKNFIIFAISGFSIIVVITEFTL
jgi:hypothetical protein